MVSGNLVFPLIGGLGFFFVGMKMMSEGLKKIAGDRLKTILHFVTRFPVSGVLAGMLVTCLIQSSSATTVMVIGFVNAGLLTLRQAIGVIMGANVGTTMTAWLVSSMSILKITNYALPAVGVGFAVMTFGKTRKARSWGEVLVGFGMLFVGLDFIKDSFLPFQESVFIKNLFTQLADNPLLGVLVGIIITVLLQSSSATIAIVQVMAFNGLVSFEAAIPLILGDNIGTTVTAQLAASAGANLNARRAAMSHTLFNLFGVAYMLFFVYSGWYVKSIEFLVPGELTARNIMLHIAVAHSVFNVINVLVFLPFTGALEKASIFFVPKRKGALDLGPQYLERHLLDTPPLAMEQAKKETIYMLTVASKAVHSAVNIFLTDDPKEIESVSEYEKTTDTLQSEITQYLIDLSQRELSPEDSEELPVWMHNVNDLEKIGDRAQNIAELARRKIDKGLSFTGEALAEARIIWDTVRQMLVEAEQSLRDNDVELAKKMLAREAFINDFYDRSKAAHVQRLNQGVCHLGAGFVFLEFIDNMEKIGDRLTNVAQSVIGKMKWRVKEEKAPLPSQVV
ncbi:MAG: Na/Pi cotransporter family protein [Candidatus Omnitrophota bacterium]